MMKKHVAVLVLLCALLALALPMGAMAESYEVAQTTNDGVLPLRLKQGDGNSFAEVEFIGFQSGEKQIVAYIRQVDGTVVNNKNLPTGITAVEVFGNDILIYNVAENVDQHTLENFIKDLQFSDLDKARIIVTSGQFKSDDKIDYEPNTDHFYTWMGDDIYWDEAAKQANQKKLAGRSGYLATLVTEYEEDIISQVKKNGYLGGSRGALYPPKSGSNFQYDVNDEFYKWYWITDPEYNPQSNPMMFTQGQSKYYPQSTKTDTNGSAADIELPDALKEYAKDNRATFYANWNTDEPNDHWEHVSAVGTKEEHKSTHERRLHIQSANTVVWNDISNQANASTNENHDYHGYFIEFGDRTVSDRTANAFTIKQVNVNPEDENADDMRSYTYYYGLGGVEIPDPQNSPEGSVFTGWKITDDDAGGNELDEDGYSRVLHRNDDDDGYEVLASAISNLTLTAQWAYPITYQHVVVDEQGNKLNSSIVPTVSDLPTEYIYGEGRDSLSTNLSSTGYTFKGWFMDEALTTPFGISETDSKAKTVYGKWERNVYRITYNGNTPAGATGTVTTTGANTYTVEDSSVTLGGTASLTGYTFTGWNTQANGNGTIYQTGDSFQKPETLGNITLYAQWSANPYKYIVEYYYQDTTGSDEYTKDVAIEDTQRMGTMDQLTNLTHDDVKEKGDKTGFTFARIEDATVNADGNATVKVYYTRNTYNITYNVLNIGTAPTGEEHTKYTYGVGKTTLPEPVIDVDSGYDFKGWYTSLGSDGTQVTSISDTQTDAVEVYAKWAYDVKVNVVWDDADNIAGRREAVEVHLTDAAGQKHTFAADGDTAHTFTELLVHKDNGGSFYDYTPVVGETVNNYTASTPEKSTTAPADKPEYTFTMKYVTELFEQGGNIAVGTLYGNLYWNDANNLDGKRPTDAVTVTLKKTLTNDQGESETTTVATNDVEAPANGGDYWPFEFTALPKYEKNQIIQYAVEVTVDNYVDNDPVSTADQTYGYLITLSPTGRDTTTKHVRIVWGDANDRDDMRPTSIMVTAQGVQDATAGGSVTLTQANAAQNDANVWEGTFPADRMWLNHTNTQLMQYNVAYAEDALPAGYHLDTANTAWNGDTYVITLMYDQQKLTLKAEVKWDDTKSPNATRPAVDVTIGGSDGNSYKLPTGDNNDQWQKSVERYKAKEAYGDETKLIVYSYAGYGLTGTGNNSEEGWKLVGGAPVVEKTYADPKNPTEDTVSAITFTYTFEPKTFKLDLQEGEGVKYPEGVEEPTEYTYGQEQELPSPTKPGYAFDGWKPVGEDSENGFTKIPSDKFNDLTLEPVWVPAPYRVVFDTLGEAEDPADLDFTFANATVTVPSVTSKSGYTFAGWYADGADGSYFAHEIATPEKMAFAPADVYTYAVATEVDDDASAEKKTVNVITLRARWLQNVGEVSVTWADENNQDGRREDVKAALYGQTTETDPATGETVVKRQGEFDVPASQDVTKHTFTGVPVHDAKGNVILYGIVMELGDLSKHYAARVNDESKPLEIVLWHGIETKVFAVQVVWNDYDNQWGVRPESLNVQLTADDNFEIPTLEETLQKLSGANGWYTQWTAQKYPEPKIVQPLKYDAYIVEGTPWAYSVEEVLDEKNLIKTFIFTHVDFNKLPETGDESNLLLWGGLLALCAAVLGALTFKRKARKD